MCGRYSLTADRKRFAEEFGIPASWLERLIPRYNIAPSQSVPILTREKGKEDFREGVPWRLGWVHWGLIPPWAKDRTEGHRMINARKETLMEKPSFRVPFRNQRCLVLADGFYEWKTQGRTKAPYYIRLKSGAPFSFAGLWSRWRDPEEKDVLSCTIITGEPNDLVRPLHSRMPVILPEKRREEWLDPANEDIRRLHNLLEIYPADEMEAYPVAKVVNAPQNDIKECIRPVKLPFESQDLIA